MTWLCKNMKMIRLGRNMINEALPQFLACHSRCRRCQGAEIKGRPRLLLIYAEISAYSM
jgi:hypothetical protein